MLCASLTPATLDDIFKSDITGADYVEVRLDYLKDPWQSLAVSWDRINVPIIATCRRRVRGGLFDGSVEEERQILEAAAQRGARYVDIDYRDATPINGADLISSYHDFDETPADLTTLLDTACAGPASIAKIAVTVRSWSDNRRLLALLDRAWPKPVIVSGMGEMGQITRIIGPSRGGFLTYATVRQEGRPSAPGQLTISEMLHSYRFRRIQRETKLFGVVGNPVSQSSGPIRHNAAFEAAGIDFAYLKFLVTDVHDFFQNAPAIGIHGFSVTMPHKIAVIPFLSNITPAALDVGAVNTVVWKDTGWCGDNTDVDGVRAALEFANFDPAGKRVVILGNKGAAKAAAAVLKDAAQVTMLSRSEVPNVGAYECDLLINATPVGMAPAVDASPVEGRIRADVVFDMVYSPPVTRLLQLAKEQGKTVVPGTIMYDAQAARQFEIWAGQNPPEGIYGKARIMNSFRIPASTSNLGAGFDALSLAVNRYLEISLQPADSFSITATGMNADSIPKGPENLIRRVASSVAAKRNRSLPQFHMHIANEIPLARGLGSSAAAIIAGITSYELMTGDRLSDDEIFRYAYEFEPHPDNLAAALYGGLITAATSATGATWVAKLTVAAGATPLVVIPDFKLSTAKARAVLPNSYSRRDAVYNIQRSALTIAALTTGQWSMLREAMRDRIHQPYRAKLIPGLDDILALEIPGLLAVALSGAGPTVFALAEPSRTEVVGQTIADVFSRFGVKATAHNLEIDTKGRVIT